MSFFGLRLGVECRHKLIDLIEEKDYYKKS